MMISSGYASLKPPLNARAMGLRTAESTTTSFGLFLRISPAVFRSILRVCAHQVQCVSEHASFFKRNRGMQKCGDGSGAPKVVGRFPCDNLYLFTSHYMYFLAGWWHVGGFLSMLCFQYTNLEVTAVAAVLDQLNKVNPCVQGSLFLVSYQGSRRSFAKL